MRVEVPHPDGDATDVTIVVDFEENVVYYRFSDEPTVLNPTTLSLARWAYIFGTYDKPFPKRIDQDLWMDEGL